MEQVPQAYRTAAEEVRAHLVALRGGAPFLSPEDARTLVQWLDDGVGVPAILRALERAAASRRKNRSRLPLQLRHAKRHMGRPTTGRLTAMQAPGDHPLRPLVLALREAPRGTRGGALDELAEALTRLPASDADTLLRGALTHVRGFFHYAWESMDDPEREIRLTEAREALDDVDGLDEATLLALTEEHARERLRRDYPLLTAATLWDLVHV